MSRSITIAFPDETADALTALQQSEGITPSEFVNRAVQDLLFLRRFRTLRERFASRAREAGVETDEDDRLWQAAAYEQFLRNDGVCDALSD